MLQTQLRNKPTLSFEVFPPKKEDEFEQAFGILNELALLNPDFISVTYGAGGSKSKKTVEIASYIQNTLQIPALAHLTCVGNTRAQIDTVLSQLKAHQVNHILALRGDRPMDMTDEQFDAREFAHATDLIHYLQKQESFQIAAACYPEKHFEALSMESDLTHLKEKQDAGAGRLITQLFFDNDSFYSFREKALRKGITIPICAGIMPITSSRQIGTTVSLSGSSIPKAMSDLIAKYADSPEDMRRAGIDYAIRQILDLKENHVDGIHIYTMNKPKMAGEIVTNIQ